MGGIDLYFVDTEVEVHCRQKVVDCAYTTCQPVGFLSLGTPLALLMWVSRGHRWVFCSRSSASISSSSFCWLLFIGCATSAPDGSSPRGYSRNFSGIGSKYKSVHLCDIFGMTRALIICLFSSHALSSRVHDEVRCAPLMYTFSPCYMYLRIWNDVSSLSSTLGRI
jgi:hypothetical protein